MTNTIAIPKFKADPGGKFWEDDLIEVGDSKQKEIFAQLKFKRWDNEGNLSIRLDSDNCGNNFKNVIWTVSESDTEIRLTYDFIQLRFYKVNDSRFECDSPEFETVLLSMPTGYDGSKLYELYYTIESKGLTATKQLPLVSYADEFAQQFGEQINISDTQVTDYEGNILVNRPDWIVNGYALQFGKQHNQYKAGSFCKIPTPLMNDANDVQIWNDILIKNKKLTVTVNENLNNLAFPIRHVSGLEFGYADAGASYFSLFRLYSYGQKFTLSEAGTLTGMSAYIMPEDTDNQLKFACFTSNGNTLKDNDESAATGSTSAAWYSATMNSVALTAADYVLCVSISSSSSGSRLYYDTGVTSGTKYQITKSNLSYASFPGTNLSSWTTNENDSILSIYGTYTTGSTPTAKNKLVMLI